jgi:hypothetical protein
MAESLVHSQTVVRKLTPAMLASDYTFSARLPVLRKVLA